MDRNLVESTLRQPATIKMKLNKKDVSLKKGSRAIKRSQSYWKTHIKHTGIEETVLLPVASRKVIL